MLGYKFCYLRLIQHSTLGSP